MANRNALRIQLILGFHSLGLHNDIMQHQVAFFSVTNNTSIIFHCLKYLVVVGGRGQKNLNVTIKVKD